MSYCVGMLTKNGLGFMSDTRTNAGLDDLAKFKKLKTWSIKGDRVVSILSAGNLATTQAVINNLNRELNNLDESIFLAASMHEIAQIVGNNLRKVIRMQADTGMGAEIGFKATLILGGQITGEAPKLYLIYPEGNFIEATSDTPFFQIGEMKYGRPILLRGYRNDLTLQDSIKLLLVSFDSTIKANLTVGFPLDFHIYAKDSFKVGLQGRIEDDNPYLVDIRRAWSRGLNSLLDSLPELCLNL